MGRAGRATVVLCAALAVVLCAAPASAAALLALDAPGRDLDAATLADIARALDAHEPTSHGPALRASLAARWVLAPDAARDAAFVARQGVDAAARNLFFENDFEAARDALAPGLDALVADPTPLAFRRDLAPAAFDAAITLVRAHDALGDDAAADETLRRAVALMWHAAPAAASTPPRVVERVASMRALVPTREVTVAWAPHATCQLWINGFAREARPGDTLRLPEGEHLAQLDCDGAQSRVVRVDPRSATLHFDLALDDALVLDADSATVRPRGASAADLRPLARAASAVLGQPVTFARLVDHAGEPVVELFRADGATFRAARAALGDRAGSAALHAATAYLVTGDTSTGIAIWQDGAGWARPDAPGARSRAWVAPTLLGAAAAGALSLGAVSELRLSNRLDAIDTCANRAALSQCDPALMPELRSGARDTRRQANVAWAMAGVLAGASTVAALVGREGDDALLVWWAPGGAGATFRARF